MKKRIIAFAITVIFLFSAFPLSGFAAKTKANEIVYSFADAINGRLKLSGNWQVSNYPDTVANINANPFKAMDIADYDAFKAQSAINWSTVSVPSNLSSSVEFKDAHRVWYHIQINMPTKDQGYFLDFDGSNWITSVIVNNTFVGSKKSTRIPWKLDVSNQLVQGVNDIYIGIKSPRYAIDAVGTSTKTTRFASKKLLSDYFTSDFEWYTTKDATGAATSETGVNFKDLKWFSTIYPSTKGDAAGDQFGLTDRLSLVATGNTVYTTDVYVKTNVVDSATFKQTATSKNISAEITLLNTTSTAKTVTVNAAAWLKGGLKEKDLGDIQVTVPANQSIVAKYDNISWVDAKLWWPEVDKLKAPMYNLKVTATEGTKSDIYSQPFGFRDIKIDGKYFRINGLRRSFWNALDGFRGNTPEEMIATFKSENNRFERMGSDLGLSTKLSTNGEKVAPNEQLDWLDENGIPVRYSTMIDGMFANFYMADNAGVVNKIMFENFRDQITDTIQNYRNHPSIAIWSLENELMFINAALLYQSSMTQIETAAKTYMYDVASQFDPTRPSMFDGGGAGMKNQFALYCHHYLDDSKIITNDNALTNLNASQGYWKYDGKRPYVAGETLYFSGSNSDHSWIGGDDAANGQKNALQAYAKFVKVTYDRFRWNDGALICPWVSSEGTELAHDSLHPIAVIPKDYKSTLWANTGFTNEYKVFNDTFSTNPITFKWSLTVKGQVVDSGEKVCTIEPGFNEKVTIAIKPVAGITEKTLGNLKIESSQEGTNSFESDLELSIFPAVKKFTVGKTIYTYNVSTDTTTALKSMGLKLVPVPTTIKVKKMKTIKVKINGKYVKKSVPVTRTVRVMKNGKYVKKNGKYVTKKVYVYINQSIKLKTSTYKQLLPKKDGILIVGHLGLKSSPGEGDSAAIMRYAKYGGRVVILEQGYNMLTSEADSIDYLPIKLYQDDNEYQSNFNFGQGFDRPILNGLSDTDLQFWNGGGVNSRVNWARTSSAKCWTNGKAQMSATTTLEIPTGNGVVTATQLKVGERIKIEPVAQYLLANLIKNANSFKLPTAVVGLLSGGNAELATAVEKTNVKLIEVSSLTAGLDFAKTPILVVEANATNLASLNTNKAKVDQYVNAGGWVMLWNLSKDGLTNYNQLLGTQHIIRPFRKEATKATYDWTTIGLSTNDYFLYNKTIIAPWKNQLDVSQDTFTNAVDAVSNIAPFHDFELQGHGNTWAGSADNNKANITNDLYNADFWHYNWQFGDNGMNPFDVYTMTLPKAESINKVVIFNNTNYNAFKSFTVTASQGTTTPKSVTLDLPNNDGSTDFSFVDFQANTFKLRATTFYNNQASDPNPNHKLAGLDEVQIIRNTPQWITDAKVKSLNSNGTLVKYERGKGGFILNQIKLSGFRPEEPRTQVAEKKYRVFSVFFQNLNAVFNKAD